MSPTAVLYCVYGVILIAGGIMGYRKTKSKPSLIAGIISGDLAILAAVLIDFHHPRSGLGLGILVSVALTIIFARRYGATRKAMPAVPLIVLSLITLMFSLIRLLSPAHHA